MTALPHDGDNGEGEPEPIAALAEHGRSAVAMAQAGRWDESVAYLETAAAIERAHGEPAAYAEALALALDLAQLAELPA